MTAARVAVWCGARNGGRVMSPRAGSKMPATECREVTVTASACSRGGRIEGSLSASMVLPVPGGPTMRR